MSGEEWDALRQHLAADRGRSRRVGVIVGVVATLAVLAFGLAALSGLLVPRPDLRSGVPGGDRPAGVATKPSATESSATSGGSPTSGPSATRALDQLATLRVRGRAPLTGYDRDEFGQSWADVDRNGCDTRNDILRRDLGDVVIRPGTNGCLVLEGVLTDPYSGRTIDFRRGQDTSSLVQVDHVVALADAWQSGAQRWDVERRTEFANDPLNLLAVEGRLNQQKGASNAASWLPPLRSAWCGFASQQIAVKSAYELSVTAPERDALERAVSRCEEDVLLAPPGPVPLGPR